MSADAGKTWSKPARIGDDKSQHPDIAITPAGDVAIVWDGRKGDASKDNNRGEPALAVVSNQNGEEWSPVWRLSAPDVNVLNPRIVSSGKQFRTFWTQGDQERGHVLMTRELPTGQMD